MPVTVLQTSGLDSPTLTAVLVAVAVLTFLWGYRRYRTSFSRTEFTLVTLFAAGVLVLAVFPDLFTLLGTVLRIERRPLVVALVANLVLTALVLYTLARTRDQDVAIAELTRALARQRADPAGDANERTVAVVVPAYNEADHVASVIEALPGSVHGYAVEAIVVSDGSSDGTAERAATTDATVVEHPINQGQGGALKTGFEIARERGAGIVVTVDADGQHPVDRLADLVAPIVDDEADYVVGSRYLGTDGTDNGLGRRAGIRVFTALINLITGRSITDCTSGFRAIRGDRLDEFTLTEERFSAPELLIEAHKNGLRIVEIPVTIGQRAGGETKKPGLRYAFGLARTIVATWIR